MNIKIKQFSSLEKICGTEDMDRREISSAVIMPGEHFSYQAAVQNCTVRSLLDISVESPLEKYIKIYSVKRIAADYPCDPEADDDYITKVPKLIPDLLVPLEKQNLSANYIGEMSVFWIEVCVPRGIAAGRSHITLSFKGTEIDQTANIKKINYNESVTLNVEILPTCLPKPETIFTQWFHTDCIASVYNTEIYSERHWQLIDKYMEMASDLGINMILTPVFIPPIDTYPGECRPNVQLVKIKKKDEKYTFDFALLRKYIGLAKKNKIKYFEISHLFSQWGCKFAPNIYVSENGKEKLAFGWDVSANNSRYAEFLAQFIPKLKEALKEENVLEQCFFHLSDEPAEEHLTQYEYARNLVKPLLGDCKTIDALSHLDFYKRGLVEHPICGIDGIEPFIENDVDKLWAYYCCAQFKDVSNRFMAMPSYRNRIIGLQLYKYGIKGFLHWGYNFYYSQYSQYTINPYVTTSTEGIFSSGDAFSVYPGNDGPLPSLRAFVFREALEDIEICKLLERKIGKKAVVKMIEDDAGMEITFKQYPKNSEFIPKIIDKMKRTL